MVRRYGFDLRPEQRDQSQHVCVVLYHVGLRLPQHVHQLLVVFLVHRDLLRHLRTETEEGHVQRVAPGSGPFHDPAIGLRRLVHEQDAERRESAHQFQPLHNAFRPEDVDVTDLSQDKNR